MSDTVKGYVASIIYSFIIGLSYIISKVAISASNPIDISAQRFLIAFIAFLPMMYFNRKELHFQLKDLKTLIPIGIFYPVLFFALQAYGLVESTSSEAGILSAVSPVIILILSVIILKEKITVKQSIFTVISVFGVLFIFIMQGASISINHIIGLVFLLMSSISFAFYNVLVRKNKSKYSVTQFSFASVLSGLLIFNAISIFNHLVHGDMGAYLQPLSQGGYILSLLYLGVLGSLGSALLSSYALKKLPASKVGVFGNLATLISMFAGAIVLKEQITFVHIIGAVFILIGVLGANLSSKN